MRNKFICCRNRLFASIGTRFSANTANSGATLIRMVLVVSLLLCALGMTVLALTPGSNQRSTTATASAATPNWSIVSSPNPTENSSYIFDATCVSDSNCWAVGRSSGWISSAQTLVEHWDGNSWVIVSSPNTSTVQTNVLKGVACASASDCWAVGFYWNGSTQQTLTEHWDGNVWSIVSAANTAPTQPNELYSVTCASASDCWAVGVATTDTNTPVAGAIIDQTLIEHWDGSSWSIVISPDTGPGNANELYHVACASPSDCWAVGSATRPTSGLGGTYETLIEHWDGTLWTIVSSPNTSSGGVPLDNWLYGVTCIPGSGCWAVGTRRANGNTSPPLQTLIERWNGASWTIIDSPNTSATQNNVLSSISCTSASNCWAVNSYYGYYDGTTTHTLTERWDGVSWTTVASPDKNSSKDTLLTGVTCVSGSACWAVGYSADPPYDNYNADAVTERWDGTSWNIVSTPNATASYASTLNSTTCTSASECWAVGDYYTGIAVQLLVELWNGTSWSIVPAPDKVNSFGLTFDYLQGVTCTSASDCWAVGYYDASGPNQDFDYQTLIEHWDGNSWTIVDSPNVNTIRNNFLEAVTCTSASDCWAVGQYHSGNNITGDKIYQTLIEHWNGAAWSIVSSPNIDPTLFHYLNSVTCVSGSDCWAVGEYFTSSTDAGAFGKYQTLIEHWDGSSWTIVTSENTSTSEYNYLYSVTCTSSANCWSAGTHRADGGSYQTLIERWNGTAWQIVSSPNGPSNQSPPQGNQLFSVTCASSSDCWAVGGDPQEDGLNTLVEHWDGVSWSFVPSPSVSSSGNSLASITCASESDCWAIGNYVPSNGVARTLTVHYALPPVQLLSAVSRKAHGTAGTFDIDLPLIGNPGIECRSGGANGDYTLVFTFANPLTSVGGASISSGTGSISTKNIDSNDARNYIVNLTGVTNAQVLKVGLTNVTDSAGDFTSAVSAQMGVLIGDVNASGDVDSADVFLVRQETLHNVDITNFREDINSSGDVDSADVFIARQQTLTSLP